MKPIRDGGGGENRDKPRTELLKRKEQEKKQETKRKMKKKSNEHTSTVMSEIKIKKRKDRETL